MRNKYPGICYRCGKRVEAGEGHFERQNGAWKTQHATCAIKYRGTDKEFKPNLVEVVRCGECRKIMTKDCLLCSFDIEGCCTGGPDNDQYCSFGERK